jgi:hypothetical protein
VIYPDLSPPHPLVWLFCFSNRLPFLDHIFAISRLLLALRGVNLGSTLVLIIKYPENTNQIPISRQVRQIEITKGEKFGILLKHKKAIKSVSINGRPE